MNSIQKIAFILQMLSLILSIIFEFISALKGEFLGFWWRLSMSSVVIFIFTWLAGLIITIIFFLKGNTLTLPKIFILIILPILLFGVSRLIPYPVKPSLFSLSLKSKSSTENIECLGKKYESSEQLKALIQQDIHLGDSVKKVDLFIQKSGWSNFTSSLVDSGMTDENRKTFGESVIYITLYIGYDFFGSSWYKVLFYFDANKKVKYIEVLRQSASL